MTTWQPVITTAGDYRIYATWPEYHDRDPAASYTIYHDDGQKPPWRSIRPPGIPWQSFELYHLAPNEEKEVKLLALE